MDACMHNFNIYLVIVAQNCFKCHTDPGCPDSFQKKVLSEVWSEIHFVRRNMISTWQSAWPWKSYIQLCLLFNFTSCTKVLEAPLSSLLQKILQTQCFCHLFLVFFIQSHKHYFLQKQNIFFLWVRHCLKERFDSDFIFI